MYKINIIGLATGKRHTVIYSKKNQQNTLSRRFQIISYTLYLRNCHKWGNVLNISNRQNKGGRNTAGQTNGRTDRQTNKWMDRQLDKRMD